MKQIFAILFFSFVFIHPAFSCCKVSQLKDSLDQAATLKESFQYQKAVDVLLESKVEEDKAVLSYLSKLLYLSGDSQLALEFILEAKKDWQDYLYLGLIYEDLGEIGKAVNAYRESLKLEKSSIALLRLGKIYREKKKYEKVVYFFQQLISYDSSQRVAYYYLGESFNRLGDSINAYRNLSRSRNFYPDNPGVQKEFQKVSEDLGRDFFLEQRKLREKKRDDVELPSYVGKENIPLVRVGIAVGLDQFSLKSPSGFQIKGKGTNYRAKGDFLYTFKIKNSQLLLLDRESRDIQATFSAPVNITSLSAGGKTYPFYLLDVVYGRKDFWHTVIDRAYRGNFEVILNEGKITLINALSVEEYLYGVLAAEIPSGSDKQALKAQAILARSLALRRKGRHIQQGFDLCADVHCQVYHGLFAETKSTREAVDATVGQVVLYEGEIPEIFYHSNSGGCLSSDIFGQQDHLASGFSLKEAELPETAYERELWFINRAKSFSKTDTANYRWQRVYDSEDFNLIFGVGLEELKGIDSKSKKQCFRHDKMDVFWAEDRVPLRSGLEIRNYFDRLRSSAFQVELKNKGIKTPNMIFFWGAGFGHGSGLCQAGAIGMAESGHSYKDILKKYYPRVNLKKLY